VARPARLLLVDNHALFRAGLKTALAEPEDVEVVAEASDGLEAVSRVKEVKPDLVLMDIDLPRCNGLRATELIRAIDPDINIVLLTYPHMGDQVFFEAIRRGARNFIPKNAEPSHLLQSLRRILKGEIVIPDHLISKVLDEIVRLEKVASNSFGAASSLTPREEEILRHLAKDLSNKEIAAILNITEGTVINHVSRILSKLRVRSRSQAVSRALEMGLITGQNG
jgi:DNA-binding NarL/FixJ family response regulator